MFMQGEPTIQDVFEIVVFMKDNMATKEDLFLLRQELKGDIAYVRAEMATKAELAELRAEMKQGFAEVYTRMATKDDIAWLDEKIERVRRDLSADMQDLQDDMMVHVDGFIGLYKKQEQELAVISAHLQP